MIRCAKFCPQKRIFPLRQIFCWLVSPLSGAIIEQKSIFAATYIFVNQPGSFPPYLVGLRKYVAPEATDVYSESLGNHTSLHGSVSRLPGQEVYICLLDLPKPKPKHNTPITQLLLCPSNLMWLGVFDNTQLMTVELVVWYHQYSGQHERLTGSRRLRSLQATVMTGCRGIHTASGHDSEWPVLFCPVKLKWFLFPPTYKVKERHSSTYIGIPAPEIIMTCSSNMSYPASSCNYNDT